MRGRSHEGKKECLYAQRIVDTINCEADVTQDIGTILKIFRDLQRRPHMGG